MSDVSSALRSLAFFSCSSLKCTVQSISKIVIFHSALRAGSCSVAGLVSPPLPAERVDLVMFTLTLSGCAGTFLNLYSFSLDTGHSRSRAA